MASPRDDPLSYNGWAKACKNMEEVFSDYKEDADSEVAFPPGEYEFECPAQSWISLVEACQLERLNERRDMMMNLLSLAKNSHWTEKLYQEELHLLDVEYGGDTQELSSPEVSQAPSNPCATCGVDTGSDRMFCDKHAE